MTIGGSLWELRIGESVGRIRTRLVWRAAVFTAIPIRFVRFR